MKCLLFGDESTLPQMLKIFKGHIAAIVFASNRPSAVNAAKIFSGDHFQVLIQPKKNSPEYQEFLQRLSSLSVDFIFCFSYSMILSNEILNIPKVKAINIHGGLLPNFRGANIYNWALIEDAKETGITAHEMTADIDNGPIIASRKIQILENDTAWTLKQKVDPLGFELLREIKLRIDGGHSLEGKVQNETEARYFKRRRPEDGIIDWTKSDREIFNLIRALVTPWPGAFYYDSDGNKHSVTSYLSRDEVAELRMKHGK